ncbi:MAG: PCRF domain-containing protein, partial [Verrucomicrobiales bacterium]|nr:PCRF domain-containing protein [Verrucomicrobiales bacterium]
MDLKPHIEKFARRLAEVERALSDPKVFEQPQRAQELGREYARLREWTAAGEAYARTLAQLEQNRALLRSEPAGSELAALAQEEIRRLEVERERLERQLWQALLPPEPNDSRNTIIEIRAGAGGT